jgi:type III pantothenate kinase
MRTMAKALHLSTAKLPEADIEKPRTAIGRDTRSAMASGIFYGHVALVEGMISRIKSESGDDPKVVATGGFASMIAEDTSMIDIVDEDLLLDGLRLIDERDHPV